MTSDDGRALDAVTIRFEEHRQRLRSVAYRMLGSFDEADDAVQEVWLRVSRADASEVENMAAWLTTITGRVCLNMLRARRARPAEPMAPHVPDMIVSREESDDPEREALLADSIGMAMFVVIDSLAPAERLAFVLHDMFAVPFDEIADIVGRTPEATRQLASRARRRVQSGSTTSDTDARSNRRVVDAFFAAARGGDLQALLAVLDPDVTLRSDGGSRRPIATSHTQGAELVASRAMMFANPRAALHPALINGDAGVVVTIGGKPFSIMAFTVHEGRVVAIDVLADPDRLERMDLSAVGV